MTNNNFNSNDFSNGCEGLENGSEQTFDKMAESVDKANVEGISSSIEENRFDEQTKETIKAIYEKDNYLLDTHTAVAYKVLLDNLDNEHASIVLSTASPYKFTESVYSSLFETQGEDEFTLMNKLHEQTKVVIPENLRDLDKKEIRHKDVINKEDMKKYILEKLGDL